MNILFIVKAIDFIDPQGIMQLSALAKAKGHGTFLGILDRDDIMRKIREVDPRVIAYSATTGEHKYYLEINKEIKKQFDVFTIMGGPHVTFNPECVDNSTLDAICVGEGDEAFVEVIEAIENGKDISHIENIHTKTQKNNVRRLYPDIDKLPFPDRKIFYDSTEMKNFPIKSFMVSRGCPYNCSYCFNHAFREMYRGQGKLLRRNSVGRVIDEILEVKRNYPLQVIKFYDDIFVFSDDEWLRDFSREYKEKIGLPFHCLMRANLVTEEIVKLLKSAGCVSMSMSIEAANPHLRNEILKRNMTDEQLYKAFDLCVKYGIKTFANSIMGIPFSTIEDDIATLDMNIKCKVSLAEFPIYFPYPRTELGEMCCEKGLFDGNYSSLHMSYQYRSPLNCFTEKHKSIQRNLSLLGTVVAAFPFLRNPVVKYLIYLPYNIVFYWLYLLSKIYVVKTKIYPFRLAAADFFGMISKSVKVDKFKHVVKNKKDNQNTGGADCG